MRLGVKVTGVKTDNKIITAVKTNIGTMIGAKFLFTTSFPIIAKIFSDVADPKWIYSLNRVKYLGNMCLVLKLKIVYQILTG